MVAELYAVGSLTLLSALFGVFAAVFWRAWRDMVESEVLFTYEEIKAVESGPISETLQKKLAYCDLLERENNEYWD